MSALCADMSFTCRLQMLLHQSVNLLVYQLFQSSLVYHLALRFLQAAPFAKFTVMELDGNISHILQLRLATLSKVHHMSLRTCANIQKCVSCILSTSLVDLLSCHVLLAASLSIPVPWFSLSLFNNVICHFKKLTHAFISFFKKNAPSFSRFCSCYTPWFPSLEGPPCMLSILV